MLYAGTTTPIPRAGLNEGALRLPVESLAEGDAPVKAVFSKPEVQYIGSTSGCGCGFPRMQLLPDGEWATVGYNGYPDPNREQDAGEHSDMEALVELLRTTGEEMVELYGFWAGDASEAPRARENASLDSLLDPDFHFKERGFYRVSLKSKLGVVRTDARRLRLCPTANEKPAAVRLLGRTGRAVSRRKGGEKRSDAFSPSLASGGFRLGAPSRSGSLFFGFEQRENAPVPCTPRLPRPGNSCPMPALVAQDGAIAARRAIRLRPATRAATAPRERWRGRV